MKLKTVSFAHLTNFDITINLNKSKVSEEIIRKYHAIAVRYNIVIKINV